jgi:hypothetical protein
VAHKTISSKYDPLFSAKLRRAVLLDFLHAIAENAQRLEREKQETRTGQTVRASVPIAPSGQGHDGCFAKSA